LTAFDPNTPDLWRVLPIFGAIGALPWDPATSYLPLAGNWPFANGLVADGVTPIVLRVHTSAANTNVTFTITDSTCPDNPSTDPPCDNGPELVGSLCPIDSSACNAGASTLIAASKSISSDPGKPDYMAFALLQAPLDFVRDSKKDLDGALAARRITVTAKLDGSTQTQRLFLTLARPPVVLLHGIWSSAATWDWPIQHDQRFQVYAQDYFDTRADYFVNNLDKPAAGIAHALQALRAKGVAATQADLVGHSMGGLLARLYAGGYSPTGIPLVPYRRNDDLGAGDIHKLITLDSPHRGSELASLLVDDQDNPTGVGSDLQGALNVGEERCITCGAVFDLRPGSPPLLNMPAITVPSHAVVGVGGNGALLAVDTLAVELLPGLDTGAVFLFGVATALLGADAALFGSFRHDLIVSEASQRGGLPDSAISTFEAAEDAASCAIDLHAGLSCTLAIHMTVTKEARISAHVIDLLNAPAQSTFFAYF